MCGHIDTNFNFWKLIGSSRILPCLFTHPGISFPYPSLPFKTHLRNHPFCEVFSNESPLLPDRAWMSSHTHFLGAPKALFWPFCDYSWIYYTCWYFPPKILFWKIANRAKITCPSVPLLSRLSCGRLCATREGSPPGSAVPGILQAGTLERAAISFSRACMHAKLLQSCLILCDLWTAARQAPLSTGFSRQEHWSGLPFPSLTSVISSHIPFK